MTVATEPLPLPALIAPAITRSDHGAAGRSKTDRHSAARLVERAETRLEGVGRGPSRDARSGGRLLRVLGARSSAYRLRAHLRPRRRAVLGRPAYEHADQRH